MALLLPAMLALGASLLGQPASGDVPASLDSIRLLCDARQLRGPVLQRYLADPHPAVRAQAALAAGSMQDTLALPALMGLLLDPDPTVFEPAAFGLGQTAAVASPPAASALSRLLPSILRQSRGNLRLIEECGKFGDAALLDSLLAVHAQPTGEELRLLALSLARFAIRGVTSAQGLSFLATEAAKPDGPWEAMYALQRAGDKPEIRTALPLLLGRTAARDPLVRVNLAAVCGKLAAVPRVLPALAALASDPDWRVRVNAMRAAGLLPAWDSSRKLLLRGARDASDHVALAALNAAAGAEKLVPAMRNDAPFRALIDSLVAVHAPVAWQRTAAALPLFASLHDSVALVRLLHGFRNDPRTFPAALHAIARIPAPAAIDSLLALIHQKSEAPLLLDTSPEGCALIEALAAMHPGRPDQRNQFTNLLFRAVRSRDLALTATAAGILADSTYRTPEAVPVLTEVLQALGGPDDVEAAQAVAGALRELGTTVALPQAPVEPTPLLDASIQLQDSVRTVLTTTKGRITLVFFPSDAPYTVDRLCGFLRSGFYASPTRHLPFHRVVPNFVVQGGDPRGDGWGGPGRTMRSEFSLRHFETGSIGIASAGKDTEGSQFFITHAPQPHLDGRYTVCGRVTSGMEVVDALQVGDEILAFELAPWHESR